MDTMPGKQTHRRIKTRITLLAAVPLLGLIGTLRAQVTAPAAPELRPPVLGYLFDDSAKQLRAIAGIPGAANLGATVEIHGAPSADRMWVHSGSRRAVMIAKDGTLALVAWNAGQAAAAQPIQSGLGAIQAVSFADSGAFAALTDGAAVEVWNLADAARVASLQINGAGVAAAAVDGAGNAAVASSNGAVYRFTGSGDPVLITTGGNFSALAVSPDGADVWAADATDNSVILIRNAASSPARLEVARLSARVASLVVAGKGTRAAALLAPAADSAADDLAVVTESGQVASLYCGCGAAGAHFETLAGDLVAAVAGSSAAGGLNYILDADHDPPRSLLLPVLRTAITSGEIGQ